MITNEQFQEYLEKVDDTTKFILNQDVLDNSNSNVEYCINAFYTKRYGKSPDNIIWVKQGNTPITEFYPSEINIPWLTSYIEFRNSFLNDNEYMCVCFG